MPYPIAAVRSRELIPLSAGPNATFAKSAYYGHDSGSGVGAEVAYGSNGDPVTYLFRVTNIGDTHLSVVSIVDTGLGITEGDMTVTSGSNPIAPGGSMVFYYETTITGDFSSVATMTANPVTSSGADLAGEPDIVRSDGASVDVVAPLVSIVKMVYAGHNGGANA